MNCIAGRIRGWRNFLKNSFLHRSCDASEALSLKRAHSDVTRLFEDILRAGTSLRVRVTGQSMRPFLWGGETLTIEPPDCGAFRTGDLILFRNREGLPVLHRLIRTRRTEDGKLSFLTKGDALRTFDEEVPGSSVLGRVRLIERPLLSGAVSHIEMDALLSRYANYLRAVLGSITARVYSVIAWLPRKKDLLDSESAGI